MDSAPKRSTIRTTTTDNRISSCMNPPKAAVQMGLGDKTELDHYHEKILQ